MKGTIIYGNGAVARVVHSYARHTHRLAGFTVDGTCITPGQDAFCGLPLCALSHVAEMFPPQDYSVLVAVGYREMNALRARKCAELAALGYALDSYVHPSFHRHDGMSFGDGVIVLDQVSIHPGCRVGNHVFISSNVNLGHDCQIGDACWINAGVAIAGGSHLGAGSFLGVNAAVGHGVRIGPRNFIAANTFVGRDTAADQVYLSEPGQRLKMRSDKFLQMSEKAPRGVDAP